MKDWNWAAITAMISAAVMLTGVITVTVMLHNSLREDMRDVSGEIQTLRTEVREDIKELRDDISALGDEIRALHTAPVTPTGATTAAEAQAVPASAPADSTLAPRAESEPVVVSALEARNPAAGQ